ncbi:TIGR04222 domain-containing membrane protein [Burkholderiaceae bacterium UC74_6]
MNARWQRIAAHPLEFLVPKLMAEQGWSRDRALQAIEEYRRFCLLALNGHAVPSRQVDEVWHLHLTFTRDYWQRFCPDALGTELHHEPGPTDAVMRERYAETLARYAETFGPPPEAWWPGTRQRFSARQRLRRASSRFFRPRMAWLGLLLLVPAAALALGPNPLDWPGPNFLGLYVVLMAVCFIATRRWRKALRDTQQAALPGSLTPYETALLAGGRARVIDVAVTELLSAGHARWDDKKHQFAVDGASQPSDSMQASVLALMRQSPRPPLSPRKLATQFEPLEARLRALGLWLDDDQARRAAWQPALLSAALLAFGALKLSAGIRHDRPIAFLVVLMLVTFFATLGMALSHPRRSREGDRMLGDLQLSRSHSMRAPRSSDLGLAVALAGTTVLAGTAYAGYHQRVRGGGDSSGSGSGDSSCSSGGDGGGGGGSGCGGCGGGGD